jgi:GDPmannose 4,6-dehydratase
MPHSLVLGVNGQDGSYLAEALLARGHRVTGIGRAAASRYVPPSSAFDYVKCDLRDCDAFARLLPAIDPDFAFHFAAIHGASGFRYEEVWRDMIAVNVLSLHVLLEYARRAARSRVRVIYAGSVKIFPAPLAGVIDEETPARATCLYGIGKMTSRDLIGYYRTQHGVNATNLVLFQHESPRRSLDYLLPTIAHTIDKSRSDREYRTTIKTLDFMIDWSDAAELMEIVAELAEKSDAQELILASGKTWNARVAVESLFTHYGLTLSRHLAESSARADPGPEFRVSLARLEREIGRRPVKSLYQIVDAMLVSAVTADLPQ